MRQMLITLLLIGSLLLVGCSTSVDSTLKGGYQSDVNKFGYVVQLAFQPDDNSFVEYIDNREVDRGTYKKIKNNRYEMKSEQQNFKVELSSDDSFEMTINKLNKGKPINMKKISNTPTYFSTKFDDVEKYKELIMNN